jgi:hypothetical protein
MEHGEIELSADSSQLVASRLFAHRRIEKRLNS